MADHGRSERHACKLLELDRSSYRYERISEPDTERKRPVMTAWTSSLEYPKLEGWQLTAAGLTAMR